MTKARSLSDFIESDGSVTLVDNQKIKVGTGNDLEIYHDGSNSYIKDVGTGRLTLQSATDFLVANTTNTQNYIYAQESGYVRLYHSGSTKLETTSTGVSVTGTITASGLVYPSSDGTNGQVLTTDGSGNLSFSTISGYTDSDVETYLDGGTATPVFSNTEISGTIKLDGNYPTGSNNVALGSGALESLTSGAGNTAVGSLALDANTSGIQNTAVGYLAGTSISTGNYNTAIGVVALQNYNVTDCVAIGAEALRDCQGNRNIGIGNEAGRYATGADNVIIGDLAADASGFSGSNNVGIGSQALGKLTTAIYNTAVGQNALKSNTTSGSNTGIGSRALEDCTAGLNTAVGDAALFNLTTGTNNTAVSQCGLNLTTGTHNTFMGISSGNAITTGSKNAIFGSFTGNSNGLDIRTSSNNVVLSDGDGNPRLFVTSDGKTNINSVDTTPRGILNVSGAVSNAVTTVLSFGDMGARGTGTAQAIDFVMGRPGFISEDLCGSIRAVCSASSATTASHGISLEFHTAAGSSQNRLLKLHATGSTTQFSTDEIPTYGNPPVSNAIVIGPTGASGNVNGGLTSACALYNRNGELIATDASLNNTQLTPHNWGLISEGPSEELAWTYWSQRPKTDDPDTFQTINVDMAKVARKVEDLIGEKLVYTENSNMDDHTHQTIISDIQSTLADLTTRIENLEG
jgi:hypothetical protein